MTELAHTLTTLDEWTAVDRYVVDLLSPSDDSLDAALKASEAAGLPAINVSACQGKLLHLLARFGSARSILEIGTLGGYSTIWLARALPDDGIIVTLEAERAYANVALANIERAGLAHVVDVRIGPALETLPRLAAEGGEPFDLIFIDADKPSYAEYFEWALRLSRRGSLIVADNVVRSGAVVDAESADEKVQGVRRFMERIAREPSVSATVVQTVGIKGHDGFAIAVVLDR